MELKVDKSVFDKAKINLDRAEKKRINSMNFLKRSVRFSLPLMAIAFFLVFKFKGLSTSLLVPLVYLVLYVFLIMFTNSSTKYEFKRNFLKPVLAELFPAYTYDPISYVPDTIFDKSKLFIGTYDTYFGDDLFTGTTSGLPFQLSDLEVSRHSRNNANWNFNTYIFKGIFLSATGFGSTKTCFIIEPKSTSDTTKTKLVKMIQHFQPQRNELPAETGYSPFDTLFRLLTSTPYAALHYLTKKRMDILVSLHEKVMLWQQDDTTLDQRSGNPKMGVYLSVIDGTLNLAVKNIQLFNVPFNDDLYESWRLCQQSVETIIVLEDFMKSWDEG